MEEKEALPTLAIDGGVSACSLGLSSIVAAQHEVPTLGAIPFAGMDSLGTREHLVIWGNTYQDREVLVGITPDVVACLNGGEGTRRECQAALNRGSAVLVLIENEAMRLTAEKGTLITCESEAVIQERVDELLSSELRANRAPRLAELDKLLAKAA